MNHRVFSSTLCAALMACTSAEKDAPMPFDVNSKITLAEGQREAFIEILEAGTQNMPGNISYTVTKDIADDNLIWIAEVWESEAAHKASLSLPSVIEAITKGRPMITGMERIE